MTNKLKELELKVKILEGDDSFRPCLWSTNAHSIRILNAKLDVVNELIKSISKDMSTTESKVGSLAEKIESFDDATLGLLNGLTGCKE